MKPITASAIVGLRIALMACLMWEHSIAVAAPRMNLISIVTDDQSEWSVGAYGNKESRTVNIDRLAREGHASPTRSSARRSVLPAGRRS